MFLIWCAAGDKGLNTFLAWRAAGEKRLNMYTNNENVKKIIVLQGNDKIVKYIMECQNSCI